MMYVHVNEANEVDRTRQDPPSSLVMADGRSVSNPDPTDVDRLAMGGWVEATLDEPTYDPDLEYLEGPTWTVTTREYINDEGTYDVEVPVLDEDGNPTYDENGNPVTEVEQRPVADGETYTVPATAVGEYTLTDREVRLETDRFQIPGDGSAFATVVYIHPGDTPPASVDFNVNGEVTTELLTTDQRAVIEVEAEGPGPIVITAGGQSLTIEATEV